MPDEFYDYKGWHCYEWSVESMPSDVIFCRTKWENPNYLWMLSFEKFAEPKQAMELIKANIDKWILDHDPPA